MRGGHLRARVEPALADRSVVYAAVGAWALSGPSFLAEFAVSLALPALALVGARRLALRRGPTRPA